MDTGPSKPSDATQAQDNSGRRRRRRRRPSSKGRPASVAQPQSQSLGDPLQEALRLLSTMAREHLDEQGVNFLSRPPFMDVQVRIPILGHPDLRGAAAYTLEKLKARVAGVRENARALVPGAVYSYFDDSATAEGCRPANGKEVFEGYTSTGRPKFADFVTLAIERKIEGVDAMLAGEELILTHVSMGRLLRTAQLHEFGRKSQVFRILGQVDAGPYKLRGTDDKAAFSFQLLRGASLEGPPVLYLHAVGHYDVLKIADNATVQILSRFQSQLEDAALRLAGLEAQVAEKTAQQESDAENNPEAEIALPLLTELARKLSGRGRRRVRRTEHADKRVADGQRPTNKAFEDADRARDDALFIDEEKETLVVVGPRGRVHAFSKAARHVTSMVMKGASIQGRQREGRWRPAEPDERGEFRMQLRQRLRTEMPPQGDEPPAGQPSDGQP